MHHTRRFTQLGALRRCAILGTLALAALALLHVGAGAVFAAPPAPTGDVLARIETAATTLADFGRPIAIVAITLCFLAWIAEPMVPDWARENRGAIGRVLFAAIVIGLAPDLVDFFITA